MIIPYLPEEVWYLICNRLNPVNITNIISSVNKKSRYPLLKMSFNLYKSYYLNKGPLIERLFILKCSTGIFIYNIDIYIN